MICKTCKIELPINDFYIRKESGNPRKSCKSCMRPSYKKYRDENSEKRKLSSYKWKRTAEGRFSSLKALSKAKNLICEVSFQYFKKLQKDPCTYCGDYFDRKAGYGIDRVDSKIGYTKSNSVACCSKCNFAKHELEYDEFINHIIKIANNINKH